MVTPEGQGPSAAIDQGSEGRRDARIASERDRDAGGASGSGVSKCVGALGWGQEMTGHRGECPGRANRGQWREGDGIRARRWVW